MNEEEEGWTKVACGSWHTVALSKNGDVLSWGGCDDGQLGHGDKKILYSPKVIEGFDGITIVDIACGSFHTAAVAKNGDLYTWYVTTLFPNTHVIFLEAFIESFIIQKGFW